MGRRRIIGSESACEMQMPSPTRIDFAWSDRFAGDGEHFWRGGN